MESPLSEQGVTVVVPTVGREKFVLDTVRDLLAQHHRPLEILIVDQSDKQPDELLALVNRNRETVSYRRVAFRGSARARNYGWQLAQYDTVVFVDDDIRCAPNLVSEHLRVLQLPGVGLVAGGVESVGQPQGQGPPTGKFARWTATPILGFAANGEFEIDHVPEGNFSVRKEVMERVGGIDETFDVPAALYEGTDLSLRVKDAGFRIYFNGKARLIHLAAPAGGNRVLEIPRYFWGLAHNRAIIIRRHLRWFQQPVAITRLGLLALAYAAHYKTAAVLAALVTGYCTGFKTGSQRPVCTRHVSPAS